MQGAGEPLPCSSPEPGGEECRETGPQGQGSGPEPRDDGSSGFLW